MKPKKRDLENLDFNPDHLFPFNFLEFKGGYLLTNDFNWHSFLSPEEFQMLLKNELNESSDLYNELLRKGFIKKDLSKYGPLKEDYRTQKNSLFAGPSLHIVAVTLRCNQNCIYCQASARNLKDEGFDMDIETAKKTVDRIFETPSDLIVIEFQGGEPMTNWEVVKYIIEYAREKEEETGKDLSFSLVTNLSLMTEEKLDYLTDKMVGICTSLDGPEKVHNTNRPFPEGNSYQETIHWIKKYREKQKEGAKTEDYLTDINALVTISKVSLDYHEEIIDEYLRLGFRAVHLRPLSYLGNSAGEFKDKMGYSTEDFFTFWKKALDYILKLNKNGIEFYERETEIKLKKILSRKDPGYTDLSSPCGAVIGQMLYDYDGTVYTCDEGRMIEDDIFKIGDVYENDYEDMIGSETTQAVVTASLLDNQTCDSCAYKPFCGVCPVKNYSLYGTLFPQIQNTGWCKLQKLQFEYIFSKLQDDEVKEIFKSWVGPKNKK